MEELNALVERFEKLQTSYPNCIILIRSKDIYYCFQKDAEVLSDLLDCPFAFDDDNQIECGCFHENSFDQYLPVLISNGYKVAIADTYYDDFPKKQTALF